MLRAANDLPYSHLRSSSRESDQLFAFLSASCLVLVLLGSLGLQTDAVAPTLGIDVTFVTVVLSSTTLLITFTALVFFVAELNAAREPAFQLTATGEAPRLELARSKRWHLFISHSWANQDAAATIKRQMQLLLPGVRIFVTTSGSNSHAHTFHTRATERALIPSLIVLSCPAARRSWTLMISTRSRHSNDTSARARRCSSSSDPTSTSRPTIASARWRRPSFTACHSFWRMTLTPPRMAGRW
jgi:hypothetical protein